MTLTEIKAATQKLTKSERLELITFLSSVTPIPNDSLLSESLIKELDSRVERYKKGEAKTQPYESVIKEAKQKYGL